MWQKNVPPTCDASWKPCNSALRLCLRPSALTWTSAVHIRIIFKELDIAHISKRKTWKLGYTISPTETVTNQPPDVRVVFNTWEKGDKTRRFLKLDTYVKDSLHWLRSFQLGLWVDSFWPWRLHRCKRSVWTRNVPNTSAGWKPCFELQCDNFCLLVNSWYQHTNFRWILFKER